MPKNIKHLVADTTAFIKAAGLQDIAENVYTIQEVIDEITNDRQRKKLVVLPYDLVVKDVFTENIKFITEFSQKTGDYRSLSAIDIKVMALTYQLEKEKLGTAHLKTAPTTQKTVKVTGVPSHNKSSNDNSEERESPDENSSNIINKPGAGLENTVTTKNSIEKETEFNLNSETELPVVENTDNGNVSDDDAIIEQIKNIDLKDEQVDELMVKVSDEEEESANEEDSDSDGGEWITPGNLASKKKEMELGDFEEKAVEVACMTSDFAMQNVLKQIGLNVTSVDGRIIKQLRTFIFRCTTCFKTTSVMTKLFCPKCGHSTLKKVAVSIDEEGNQHIHINGRKPLTAKGKKFSLPTPRGGQHFQYPLLTEDQHFHKRFATKTARAKTNALDPDYTAGFSPFAVRDLNSRSAILGVRAHKEDVKYWLKNYSKGKKK
ncbi:unnamed protein product [Arctia plantaginis]|uniref:RNA-binding protein NOB1 n=1 Tax=Arctia plantaginis TaxID=874455 RepID=A0A8S1AFZ2_ARCPL|nr:unnamed protein product [Arctia plantaginis]CAB3253927.1 unnamed protein product [Arctia plantaginis]